MLCLSHSAPQRDGYMKIAQKGAPSPLFGIVERMHERRVVEEDLLRLRKTVPSKEQNNDLYRVRNKMMICTLTPVRT